jgi:hypothetical protein
VPQPWAAEPGSARPESVGKTVGAVGVVALYPAAHGARVAAQQLGDGGRRPAVLGQQDHDQAQGDAVRAVLEGEQIAGAACTTGWVGVHARGRILAAASSGRVCCGRLQRPARLLPAMPPIHPGGTSRTSCHPLSRPMASCRLSTVASPVASPPRRPAPKLGWFGLPNKAQPDILSSVMTKLVGGSFTRCKRSWLSGWPLPQSWSLVIALLEERQRVAPQSLCRL